ncbi:UNVERIFIED_CONTAM: hypothetical protein HDU68_001956 [Siphonaria sp. JEL0065]|nr:hypothetical protein HDU68_001956 [Siphonaria sp. JEL0065]
MRREGSTFSDTQNKSVHTNATVRRTDHCLKDLPNNPCFILPPGMTVTEALAKAEDARSARNLLHGMQYSLSDIDSFDQKDFLVLNNEIRGRYKSTFTWSDLPQHQKDIIKNLANLANGMYKYSTNTDWIKAYAASGILSRHKRLDKEMKDLEKLGFGPNQTVAGLTKTQRLDLQELAEGIWINVKHDNLFTNEKTAIKSLDRQKRKLEASPKSQRWGYRHRLELNPHGIERATWRSEFSVKNF